MKLAFRVWVPAFAGTTSRATDSTARKQTAKQANAEQTLLP
ncbi:MAG: hypothetical protein U1F05_02270 [Burkholderiales bacterium]